MNIYDILGTVGASLILFGFYRTSVGKWKNKSFWYELDNTVGALFLIVYQWHLNAYISVILNTIWAIVAFRGLTSFAERYNRAKKHSRRRSAS
jgi:hypothetical protein